MLQVNGPRLWASLMEMAQVGATDKGGVRRLALTDEDRRGRDLFAKWCREAGMTVSVDEVGNLFARREGADPMQKPVLIGSHLDTQPEGGRFDGVYGVLAALELVRTLNDHGIVTGQADRDRLVDQRRRRALHAGDARLGGVRRRDAVADRA